MNARVRAIGVAAAVLAGAVGAVASVVGTGPVEGRVGAVL